MIHVVGSLAGQADRIIVALNGYTEVPPELHALCNVECVILDNSLGDAAKFIGVDNTDGVYLSCDDDILYPIGYVQDCLNAIEKYHCVITFHGKRFDRRPIEGYHRSFTTNVRCLGSLAQDIEVHVGGTGVMAFNTKDFKISIRDFGAPNMADLWVAKKAHEQGVKIMAIAHQNNYFHYLGTPDKTIWQMRRGNPYETNLVRSFLK